MMPPLVHGIYGSAAFVAVDSTLLDDSFTDSNSTSLDAHTPEVGGGWVERNGVWDIQSDRANASGSAPGGVQWFATADVGQADFDITAVINAPSGAGAVIFRYSPADGTHYMVNLTTTTLRLFYYDGSTYGTHVISASGTFTAGQDHAIRVIVEGSNVIASVGAASFVYTNASNNTDQTHVGMRATAAGVRFDDYVVEPPAVILSLNQELVIGLPQANGVFYDGSRYWLFYQDGQILKCRFGAELNSTMVQTGGDLVEDVNATGKAYSILFGRFGGAWHAWALVSRDEVASTEGMNLYRWQLTPSGLGVVSAVAPSVSDVLASATEITHEFGGATVSRLYQVGHGAGNSNIRAVDGDLTDGVDMGGWNLASATFGERLTVLRLVDGYIAFANNSGPESANAWERLKTNEGDAWGSEVALGFTNQAHATNTSHTGQCAICQLDDGTIYFAYCDDLDSVNGDYGRIVLKTRGNAQASTWSEVSADVIGGDVGAWHIAIATDGIDVWLFYVKDAAGSRDSAIYYKKYDVGGSSFGSEVKVADIEIGRTFSRMFTQWRAANGEAPVVWSEVGGVTYYVRSAVAAL